MPALRGEDASVGQGAKSEEGTGTMLNYLIGG